ncbi:uncharacterized protein DS421_20g703600 [Arachis hypogaea]|nr:uncharacterized protein DS421_20g703600 [Arachis hypogaea]
MAVILGPPEVSTPKPLTAPQYSCHLTTHASTSSSTSSLTLPSTPSNRGLARHGATIPSPHSSLSVTSEASAELASLIARDSTLQPCGYSLTTQDTRSQRPHLHRIRILQGPSRILYKLLEGSDLHKNQKEQ